MGEELILALVAEQVDGWTQTEVAQHYLWSVVSYLTSQAGVCCDKMGSAP